MKVIKCADTGEVFTRYKEYLQSVHWSRFRAAYFKEQGEKVCVQCTSRDRVQLHHLTYARIGREQFGDVVALCDSCHRALHKIVKDAPKEDLRTAEQIQAEIDADGKTPELTAALLKKKAAAVEAVWMPSEKDVANLRRKQRQERRAERKAWKKKAYATIDANRLEKKAKRQERKANKKQKRKSPYPTRCEPDVEVLAAILERDGHPCPVMRAAR